MSKRNTTPAKIVDAIETIEQAGNTVEILTSGNEYVKMTAIRFDSIERHPLISSHGQVIFSTSYSTGRTRFHGGTLSTLLRTIKIRTYSDLRITTEVWTASPRA